MVGCGWISHQVHLPLLAEMRANGRVGELWVSDFDQTVATQTARKFGARHAEHDADDLAVDLVVVATTPRTHADLTIEALERGAHVVVEKPLALTGTEAARIAGTCAATGRRVFPLYTARHRADVEAMRSILATDLGWAHTVRLSWLRSAGLPGTRGGREAGVLWDLGSHLVDTGLHVTGWLLDHGIAAADETDPAQGPAVGRASWQSSVIEPDEVAWCGVEGTVTTPAGQTLSLQSSWSTPKVAADETRVHVVGRGGASLTLRTVFGWSPHRQSVPEPALWRTSSDGAVHVLLDRQLRDPWAEYAGQWDAALTAFADPSPSRWELSLHVAQATTRVLEALQLSLNEHAPRQIGVKP